MGVRPSIIERVAIPAFQVPLVAIERWKAALERELENTIGCREEGGETFLVVESRGIEGQVAFDGIGVEAILFEIEDVSSVDSSLAAIEQAAASVGYELYDPEDDEDED